jgi:DNA-binding SARP family transcriptional activator
MNANTKHESIQNFSANLADGNRYAWLLQERRDAGLQHAHPASLQAGGRLGICYPVMIFTLGRFSVHVNGHPLQYGKKVPRRPLDLLKALISMGARQVSCNRLSAALWPDADGDMARKTFDTTLHRLRRLLGHDEALLCVDGALSLNPRLCSVDIWTFEQLANRISRLIDNSAGPGQVLEMQQLCDQLCRIYQQHFLQQDDCNAWTASMRERMRSKFIHLMVESGNYWEQRIEWSRALACYRKGLETDDLIEEFYQRSMRCYLALDRISEGMAAYRRCRQILSVVLGLKPEPRTEKIYASLKRARTGQQSA